MKLSIKAWYLRTFFAAEGLADLRRGLLSCSQSHTAEEGDDQEEPKEVTVDVTLHVRAFMGMLEHLGHVLDLTSSSHTSFYLKYVTLYGVTTSARATKQSLSTLFHRHSMRHLISVKIYSSGGEHAEDVFNGDLVLFYLKYKDGVWSNWD